MTAEILVVDDSPDQAGLVTGLLERAGYDFRLAETGEHALEQLESFQPDLIVTDLVMPGMDGLALVEAVRTKFPNLPVVLITAFGSGEVALRALKRGAASYVPKRRIVEDLLSTIDSVLAVSREELQKTRLLESLIDSRYEFRLSNDEDMIPCLVQFIQDRLTHRFRNCDENVLMQIGIAIQEAVRNAMHHGNLEVSSDLRETSVADYSTKIDERMAEEPYMLRSVVVEVDISRTEFRCMVRDEGPGFDPALIADPTDPDNLLKTCGRGLYLISTFMDEVKHNDAGNEVVMTKTMQASLG